MIHLHLTHTTHATRKEDVIRKWRLVDLRGKVLGRAATDIANMLIGKNKASYSQHVDGGDFVVVINAEHVVVTGRKEQQKMYTRYSGYPGGLKKWSYALLHSKDPRKIIQHAVSGMIPKNRLHDDRMSRLFVFSDDTHPYQNKFEV